MTDGRPALVIDCSEIGKAKNDAGLVSALAEETGMSHRERSDQLISRILSRLFIPIFHQRHDRSCLCRSHWSER